MEIYLGIDGGGTKTQAVLVDAHGRVLGEGAAGPSNYHNVGIEAAGRALRGAAASAWSAAGRKFGPATAAFLGCAGVKGTVDAARLKAAAETAELAPAGQITVVNDLHNAHAGGLGGQPGIALIAGTGTHCLGRDASGASFLCGGWGWILDDEGAGIGLALAGLRAAVKSADHRAPATGLLAAALAFFGLSEPEEILAHVCACPPADLGAFAPVVIRQAAEGDARAAAILRHGARALAGLVATTARALSFSKGSSVVLLGSCVRSGAPYQPQVEAAVRKACPGARIIEPMHSPLHGAALNALRAAGRKRAALSGLTPS